MPERIAEPGAREAEGLCAICAAARGASPTIADRSSCSALYSTIDPSFPKYPRLPVLACRAFAKAGDDGRS